MAEALAIIGSLGAICNLVDVIGKVVSLINDLVSKWEDAELTLLSMASQLIALRAASTKIREWMERGLGDAHHQLIMDLDVSIKCCQLLINKIESFFLELDASSGKSLEVRQKFKIIFGSAGPENIQKMIERQTSALTLLLTACNCNTLSEQHHHLEATKTRRTLRRAQADSVSLYVQRDTASFTSKITDNLSKMSRVFDFDRNVFSTNVYERAFRGTFQQALRKRHGPVSAALKYENIYLVGDGGIAKDSVINGVGPMKSHPYSQYWTPYRTKMGQVCVDLMCAIIKQGTPDWSTEHVSVLLKYTDAPPELRPTFDETLDACAILWWSAVRRLHQPDVDTRGDHREVVHLRRDFESDGTSVVLDMLFSVDIIPGGGLNIYCNNRGARYFMQQMDHVLPLRTKSPRFDPPSPADICRARAFIHPSRVYERRMQIGTAGICLTEASHRGNNMWPSFQELQHALAIAYCFDLRDYGSPADASLHEMQTRLESHITDLVSLSSRGATDDLQFLLLLTGFEALKDQILKRGFVLSSDQTTNDYGTVMAHIESRFRQVVNLPFSSLIVEMDEDVASRDLLSLFHGIALERNGLQEESQAEAQHEERGSVPETRK